MAQQTLVILMTCINKYVATDIGGMMTGINKYGAIDRLFL